MTAKSGTSDRRTLGILAFEGMEVLDYAGPYEVFNVASEIAGGAFQLSSLAVGPGNVAARGGFVIVPDVTYADADVPDVLIVPGGDGTRALLSDEQLLGWLRTAAGQTTVLASVCTGALVLGAAGLLENLPATTHHRAYEVLTEISPTTKLMPGERFVRADEKFWTSGGISAGIDMSLAIVAELLGPRIRDEVIAVMEWGWPSRSSSDAEKSGPTG